MLRKLIKAARLLPTPRYLKALRHGVAATVEHKPALRGRDFKTVIDAGANNGQFALLARELFPHADIYSFEPLAGAAKKFDDVFRNDHRVRLFRTALGAARGEAPIHISAANDSSSLLPMTDAQTQVFPGTGVVDDATVEVSRLDDVLRASDISRPALLKLDVQGYELNALRGAERIMAAIDAIYVECSFVELYRGQPLIDDICAFLRTADFRTRGFYNLIEDNHFGAVQVDVLLERTE